MYPEPNPARDRISHLVELIEFVRSASSAVMGEIDTGACNMRNAVYQLAQVNITLADIVSELMPAE